MTKLALIFIVSTVTFSLVYFGESLADTPEEENDRAARVLEEDLDELDRAASATATATAIAGPGTPAQPTPNGNPKPQAGLPPLSRCFACVNCPSVSRNTSSKYCSYSPDPSRQGRCVVYAEKYSHMKEPFYVRGCMSERGTCADIKQAHKSHKDLVKLVSCKECRGHNCNTNAAGIPHSLPDIMMATLVLIIAPVLTKYTLS